MADYSVAYNELYGLLQSLPTNTEESPYDIELSEITSIYMKGNSTPVGGTLQSDLINNYSKYVAISFGQGCVQELEDLVDTSYLFDACKTLVSINVRAMGNVTNAYMMFAGCINLKSVNISSMSSVLNASAMFYRCTSLKTLDLSALTESETFAHACNKCENLRTVSLPVESAATNTNSMFEFCSSLTSVNISCFTEVERAESMFSRCTNLTAIDVSYMTRLVYADNMFSLCESLVSLDLSRLSSLAQFTQLSDCLSLEEFIAPGVKMGDSIRWRNLFNNCPCLKYVNIAGADNLPSFSMNNTPALESVNISGSTVTSTAYKFENLTTLKSVDMTGMRNLKNARAMFRGCTSLESVEMSSMDFLENISFMFKGCSSITDIDFYALKNAIYLESTFEGCLGLVEADVSLFPGVGINQKTFKDCTGLEIVKLPGSNATNINVNLINQAFENCTSLKEIHGWNVPITSTVTNIFNNCPSLEAVYVPPSTPSADAETWRAFSVSHGSGTDDTVTVYDTDGTVEASASVTNADGRSVEATDWVDELILSDAEIPGAKVADMMATRLPVTGDMNAADPSEDTFTLWVKNGDRKRVNMKLSDFTNDMKLSDFTNDMKLSDFTNDMSLSDFTNDQLIPVGRPANVQVGSIWLG